MKITLLICSTYSCLSPLLSRYVLSRKFAKYRRPAD